MNPMRNICKSLSLVVVGAILGCDVGPPPPPGVAAPAAPAPAPPPPPPPAEQPQGEGEAVDARPLGRLDVLLSTGVSLAQTGPDGTLMSFSVDYEFPGAVLQSEAEFALVIERRDGQTLLHRQQLRAAGNLAVLAPGWRPEDGPFYAYLVELNSDGQPLAQSDRIELTSP